MKYLFTVALIACCSFAQAQEMPEMPRPVKEHAWLKKLAGKWTCEGECYMEPGAEPMKSSGTETARMLGDFWVVSEGTGEAMGESFSNVLTIGYDPDKAKYVATWVDSMTGRLWTYEGTVEGEKLTLRTEGPCPMTGKHLQFRDEIEFSDADHRTMTSYVSEDGKQWTKAMQMTATRE